MNICYNLILSLSMNFTLIEAWWTRILSIFKMLLLCSFSISLWVHINQPLKTVLIVRGYPEITLVATGGGGGSAKS